MFVDGDEFGLVRTPTEIIADFPMGSIIMFMPGKGQSQNIEAFKIFNKLTLKALHQKYCQQLCGPTYKSLRS
jgi:hypothetical protein